MYTYRNSGKKISQADLSKALNRLGDLLKGHNSDSKGLSQAVSSVFYIFVLA